VFACEAQCGFCWRAASRHPQRQSRCLQPQAFFSHPQLQLLQSQAPQQAGLMTAFTFVFFVFGISFLLF
jgi:wyosine [tRNA(Phe)-imidazoG37] synthetase (radical SAM superfamily)